MIAYVVMTPGGDAYAVAVVSCAGREHSIHLHPFRQDEERRARRIASLTYSDTHVLAHGTTLWIVETGPALSIWMVDLERNLCVQRAHADERTARGCEPRRGRARRGPYIGTREWRYFCGDEPLLLPPSRFHRAAEEGEEEEEEAEADETAEGADPRGGAHAGPRLAVPAPTAERARRFLGASSSEFVADFRDRATRPRARALDGGPREDEDEEREDGDESEEARGEAEGGPCQSFLFRPLCTGGRFFRREDVLYEADRDRCTRLRTRLDMPRVLEDRCQSDARGCPRWALYRDAFVYPSRTFLAGLDAAIELRHRRTSARVVSRGAHVVVADRSATATLEATLEVAVVDLRARPRPRVVYARSFDASCDFVGAVPCGAAVPGLAQRLRRALLRCA